VPGTSLEGLPIYLPAAVALVLVPLAFALPHEAAASAATALLGIGVLLSAGAGLLLLFTWVGWDRAQRRAQPFGAAIATLFAASVVAGLGSAGVLLPATEAWNLTLVSIPIVLAGAILARPVTESSSAVQGAP